MNRDAIVEKLELRPGITDFAQAIDLKEMGLPTCADLDLMVAGMHVRVSFAASWAPGVIHDCLSYWRLFVAKPNTSPPEFHLHLAPAAGAFIDPRHSFWNSERPFLHHFENDCGKWIAHRDFVALMGDHSCWAWLPTPTPDWSDSLDNLLALCLRPVGEKKMAFLFHSAVIEHEKKAVLFFGPSGIGKSTLAKFSRDWGLRVMGSDQVYLRIEETRLLASASPTCNPDIPRRESDWTTTDLEVKTVLALSRALDPKQGPTFRVLETNNFIRRFFTEIFRDESDLDFARAFSFALSVSALPKLVSGDFSYPYGDNFWPYLEQLGYL